MTNKSMFAGLGKLPAAVLLLIGIPFLVIGVRDYLRTAKLIAKSEKAQGIVIDHEYRYLLDPEGSGNRYVFRDPVVRFTTLHGEVITFTEEINNISQSYEVGDFVEILYDENIPSRAIIRSWDHLWQEPVFFLSSGLIPILVLIPWTIWTYYKRREGREAVINKLSLN